VSKVIGNPLTNSSESIDNFYKYYIFARGLPITSNPYPEGIDYPPKQLSDGCPINKERGNFSAISLKKPTLKDQSFYGLCHIVVQLKIPEKTLAMEKQNS
jgi:hypothetical protein